MKRRKVSPKEPESADDKWLLVAIPMKLHRRLKSEAALRGISARDLVIKALESWQHNSVIGGDE
jgi:predicted HicB family RNase H-like nuclease